MREQLRVAIIGTGAISHRHMKIWKHISQVSVIAAADINEMVLRAWGEKYHINNLYTDFRELLKRDDIDAVDVCVHNNLHTPIAMAVMKAGLDCYSEKPMAASYADSKLLYDCAKATGKKLAIQISSLFSAQTYIAKKLIDAGRLGEIYHARSAIASWRRRPCHDRMAVLCSPAFQDKQMAGHGPIVDIGVYHLGQMLYLIGLPELDTVFGCVHQKVLQNGDEWSRKHPVNVEDMGAGFASFKKGISLEFMEASAINVGDVGKSYIAGSKGGLQYSWVDEFGGDWAMGEGKDEQLPQFMQPTLIFTGIDDFGFTVTMDYHPYDNQQNMKMYTPESTQWFDNQLHWFNYLTGKTSEETRYDTPLIALNASLLTEGLVISSELGRAITADEIRALSKSTAIWHQETAWGIFDYDSTL